MQEFKRGRGAKPFKTGTSIKHFSVEMLKIILFCLALFNLFNNIDEIDTMVTLGFNDFFLSYSSVYND